MTVIVCYWNWKYRCENVDFFQLHSYIQNIWYFLSQNEYEILYVKIRMADNRWVRLILSKLQKCSECKYRAVIDDLTSFPIIYIIYLALTLLLYSVKEKVLKSTRLKPYVIFNQTLYYLKKSENIWYWCVFTLSLKKIETMIFMIN